MFSFNKKAARATFHADRQAHAWPYLTITNSLNVYQFNIQQVLVFMQRVKKSAISRVNEL